MRNCFICKHPILMGQEVDFIGGRSIAGVLIVEGEEVHLNPMDHSATIDPEGTEPVAEQQIVNRERERAARIIEEEFPSTSAWGYKGAQIAAEIRGVEFKTTFAEPGKCVTCRNEIEDPAPGQRFCTNCRSAEVGA